ncbi:MAG: septal ring lytic transglycosylase RlpA family protein [Nitrospiraceae bacterium]|nr:MAG: septal ring lytic transglycosylase RlpA family protein [Nitrospiraceae bacterium]
MVIASWIRYITGNLCAPSVIILLMKRLAVIIGLVLLTSCASSPPRDYEPGPEARYVTASWYGKDFHGRPTSSGERYDMHGFTAAHKTMKFGTRLRVTNPDTDKSVDVIVNDRGPFIWGRDLDLSYGAAREIGFVEKGVGEVRIEYLGRDIRYAKRVPFEPTVTSSYLTVQVGSFVEESNAMRLKQGLQFEYSNVFVTTVFLNGKTYHRVRIGEFSSYDSAYVFAQKLADEGYSTLIMAKD